MKNIVRFTNSRPLPRIKDSTEYIFNFMIDNKRAAEIKVSISGVLVSVWFQDSYDGIENILFQFAKQHLVKKLQTNTLSDQEEVVLLSSNQPPKCPYKKSETTLKHGETFGVEIKDKR